MGAGLARGLRALSVSPEGSRGSYAQSRSSMQALPPSQVSAPRERTGTETWSHGGLQSSAGASTGGCSRVYVEGWPGGAALGGSSES